ncbi:MAG TPA: hypothetical protein VN429_04775 [Methanospirillum sp.]|nr:hypothetical protein [Methanospirillum sp.]
MNAFFPESHAMYGIGADRVKVIVGEMNDMGGPKGYVCRYGCDIRPILPLSEEHYIKFWFLT